MSNDIKRWKKKTWLNVDVLYEDEFYARTPDLEKTFMTPVKQYEKCELCNSEITTDFGIMKCLECNVYIDSNGIIRSLGKDSQ